MSEEEYRMRGSGKASDDYQSQLSDSDIIKLELLKGLIAKHVNLSDLELSELTGFAKTKIRKMREPQLNEEEVPLSWDYVLAFDVGDDADPKKYVKPKKKDLKAKKEDDNDPEWENGMSQAKYYGQIFNNFWQRLEAAKLSVEAYKSQENKVEKQENDDNENENEAEAEAEAEAEEEEVNAKSESMFLIVGITESNLKKWADDRDTDLLIDPKGGVIVGRERDFALAKRTILAERKEEDRKEEAEQERKGNETLDLTNWSYLYGEYSQYADQRVYKHYKRLPDNDSIETVFDERTRLRIIYESIIADTNEGGAEIRIADDLLNKKHPLKAVFPLHNAADLEYFNREWIKRLSPSVWMWCPLSRVRDYFGEPVAFYFAFLVFYLKWLISPAIIGLIFFVWQVIADEVAVTGIPFLCFFMIFWSVAFVDFWARAEARYRLMWGMTKFEQKAVARPQFSGQWQHDNVSGLWIEEFSLFRRACRASAIYTFVSIWVSCCVVSVIFILLQRDENPNDFMLKIMLGVANAVMIFVFDMIYKVVSRYGNEWENHRTEQDFQNAMIYKSFCFKFVNSFASLFYLGFIRPGQNGLYYYVHFYDKVCPPAPAFMGEFLGSYDTSGAHQNDYAWYTDNVLPTDPDYALCLGGGDEGDLKCIALVEDSDNQNEAWQVVTDGFYPDTAFQCPSTSLHGNAGDNLQYISDVDSADYGKCYGGCEWAQTALEQNEAVLDELRIQLLTLFLTAIVIQNTLEVGIPLLCQKIRDSKAAQLSNEKSIAEVESEKDRYENTIDDMSELIIQFGYVTLFVMAFPLTPLLAIVNNIIEMKVDATNLVATSQRPDPNGSFGLGSWNGVLGFFSVIAVATNVGLITWRTKLVTVLLGSDASAQWIFFSVLSVALGILVGVEKWVIPDVPIQVEQAIERQRLVESVLILGASTFEEDKKPDIEDDEDAIPFDPSLEFIDVKTLPDVPYNLKKGRDNETA